MEKEDETVLLGFADVCHVVGSVGSKVGAD